MTTRRNSLPPSRSRRFRSGCCAVAEHLGFEPSRTRFGAKSAPKRVPAMKARDCPMPRFVRAPRVCCLEHPGAVPPGAGLDSLGFEKTACTVPLAIRFARVARFGHNRFSCSCGQAGPVHV